MKLVYLQLLLKFYLMLISAKEILNYFIHIIEFIHTYKLHILLHLSTIVDQVTLRTYR